MMRSERPKLIIATMAAFVVMFVTTGVAYVVHGDAAGASCEPNRDVRWINVCITVPIGVPIEWHRDGPVIIVRSASANRFNAAGGLGWEPELVIVGETGAVLDDSLAALHPAETAAIVRSIRVLDEPTEVWPFVAGEPSEYHELYGVRVGVPDPSAGIEVEFVVCFSILAPGRKMRTEIPECDLSVSYGEANATFHPAREKPALVEFEPRVREAFQRVFQTAEYRDE